MKQSLLRLLKSPGRAPFTRLLRALQGVRVRQQALQLRCGLRAAQLRLR